MNYRKLGRTQWDVSDIGYGMWGLAGWADRNDEETRQSLQLAVDMGCNFFDTALAYGDGLSEKFLGELLRANPEKNLIIATKIPPKNRIWPSQRGFAIADVFPDDYIKSSVETSLTNLGADSLELIQFHVWEDTWHGEAGWQRTVESLKTQGLVRAVGISVNRWEPTNVLKTLETGLIDAVQVIYNIFDQNPEDELFPYCVANNIGVIARVPFDEGTLTGNLTKNSTWPAGDWRNTYFVPENLHASVDRAEQLRPLIPQGITMAEMALRFILSNPAISTIIPGMRKNSHVLSNIACSDAGGLPVELLTQLKAHRWDRTPTSWSQ